MKSDFIKDIYFELLGVTRTSTTEEIKKAYREKITKCHPDKFSTRPDKIVEAEEKTKKLNEAYEILKNYEPLLNSSETPTNPTNSGEDNNYYHKTQSTKSDHSRIEINRIRVNSSNIHSIGYAPELKMLQVQFLNGSVYQYYDVPANIYNELMKADSKGKYLNRNIAFKYQYD